MLIEPALLRNLEKAVAVSDSVLGFPRKFWKNRGEICVKEWPSKKKDCPQTCPCPHLSGCMGRPISYWKPVFGASSGAT